MTKKDSFDKFYIVVGYSFRNYLENLLVSKSITNSQFGATLFCKLLKVICQTAKISLQQCAQILLFDDVHLFGVVVTGRNEVVAKVMFLHVSVILLTGGVSGEPPWTKENPPGTRQPPQTRQPPPDQATTPPRTKENPPGPGNPPGTRQPHPPAPRRTPPDQGEPPGTRQPHPPQDQGEPPPHWEEHCSIRSMSGRYASYWNAFLFDMCLSL